MSALRPLVVFDMDGVLVHERSSWGLVHDALGTNNESSHEAYLRGEIDDHEFMRRDIALWLNARPDITISEIDSILDDATPMEGTADCLDELRSLGARTVILSGGLKLLSTKLAKRFGFDDHYANGLAHGHDGRLTGEGVLEVPLKDKGGVLTERINAGKGYGPVITIGDSSVDVSMFKRSDLAIAFRPKDGLVRRKAHIVIDRPDLKLVAAAIREHMGGLKGPELAAGAQ